MEKKLPSSPFMPRESTAPGKGDFDTEYESIKIIDHVVKTGEGDEDYIIEKKVIVEKTPIQDVIDADKDSVGVENIIRQVLRTGDSSLLPADKGDCNVDLVGAPESLMELKQMGVNAEKAFEKLPPELVNGLDMKTFVETMSQDKFDEFIKAVAERATKKTEVKTNE